MWPPIASGGGSCASSARSRPSASLACVKLFGAFWKRPGYLRPISLRSDVPAVFGMWM